MKAILATLVLLILVSGLAAQETDTLRQQSYYKQAWDAAMENGKITNEERALLDILVNSMLISVDSSRAWESRWTPMQTRQVDQSGRWPLVLQNIAIGSGLYGWGVPYVLHAEDGRWYVGGVMVSAGTAFYLTYEYTKNMEMSHARTQMMRYGSLLGLRYGIGLNTLLELEAYPDGDRSNNDAETLWMWMLMASVPAGHYGGEYLFDKLEPSNGQAWAWTMWTGISGLTSTLIFSAINSEPDRYNEFDSRTDDRDNEWQRWRKQFALTELISYPIGAYFSYGLVKDKQYSFGDALMLMQGWGFGFMNTMMLQSILFDDGDEETFFMVAGLGAIGSTLAYDRMIAPHDYSFGQSTLMLLGSASGTAFGFGTAILLDVSDPEPMLTLALAGYAAGTRLTRKILDVKPDGSLAYAESHQVSLVPTVFPAIGSHDSVTLIPALDLRISFK